MIEVNPVKDRAFEIGDRVRSAKRRSVRVATVTVALNGQILALRYDGETQDTPVREKDGRAFDVVDVPVPVLEPTRMDAWEVTNEAFDHRTPMEITASFVTTIAHRGRPTLRVVSRGDDAFHLILPIRAATCELVRSLELDLHDWSERFCPGDPATTFYHWVAWTVDHRPYGVSPSVYFADPAVARRSDPKWPYPVVRSHNTIDQVWMPGDRVCFYKNDRPCFGIIVATRLFHDNEVHGSPKRANHYLTLDQSIGICADDADMQGSIALSLLRPSSKPLPRDGLALFAAIKFPHHPQCAEAAEVMKAAKDAASQARTVKVVQRAIARDQAKKARRQPKTAEPLF